MKCLLSVCLVACSVTAAVVHSAVVQIETKNAATAAQPLQKGISVELASANNAQPMPEADNADAWVVTVTNGGQLYFGVKPVTAEELKEQMISHPRRRTQRLYIKADARAPFADVEKALDAASAVEFESPVLLTGQQHSVTPGTMVSPSGLEVLIDGAAASAPKSAIVELTISAQGSPTLKINNSEVPWAGLQVHLKELMQNRKEEEKIISLTANARSPFAEVAHAIDACRSAGAQVVLATPSL